MGQDSSSSGAYYQLHLACLIECQISMNTIATGLTNVGGLGFSGVPRSQAVESRSIDGEYHWLYHSMRHIVQMF